MPMSHHLPPHRHHHRPLLDPRMGRGRAVSTPVAPITGSDRIHNELRALHADELAYLSQQWKKRSPVEKVVSNSYTYLFCRMSRRYLKYLWQTWTRALWSTFFLPTTIFDRLSIAAFALVSSWIVFFLLVWCLIANHPLFAKRFKTWSQREANGLSMINALYPHMFNELSEEQIKAAKDALARPLNGSPNTSTKRVFNLDIAKLLLLCSALMYERTSAPLRDALDISAQLKKRHHHRHAYHHAHHNGHRNADDHPSRPGELLSAVLGPDAASKVSDHLHANAEEDLLASFATRLGLCYNTVSELNSQGSAFCGMFWDPDSTWIILAYKGTSPTEFVEWTTDFSFNPRDVGHWIRGWGKAHGGFVDKIFPRKIKPGARLPYDTIREAVKAVSKHLLANKPSDTQINVWTTGHSLGCALASLVYARQINEPRDLGKSVMVRDAYLFAAPILCDVESVNAFDNRMNHDADHPRTMWRVTNGLDCVARSLPHSGDYNADWNLSPYNLFSYAHIGTEVRLVPQTSRSRSSSANAASADYNDPYAYSKSPRMNLKNTNNVTPIVAGKTHITPGSRVRIESALLANVNLLTTVEEDAEARKKQEKIRKMQRWPVLGRLVAHGTASYWMALNEVRTGNCEWEEE